MASCETCGADLFRDGGVETSSSLTPPEELGKIFYGLSRDAALCPQCLEDVRLTGATLQETDLAGPCPVCGVRLGLGEEPLSRIASADLHLLRQAI